MTSWVEVTLRVDGEAAEAVADLLQRYGHQGVSIEQEGIPPDKLDEDQIPPPTHLAVRAYFPADGRMDETKAQLESALSYMSMMYPMPVPTYNIVADEDWAEAWKKHYHPIRIGKRLFIRPRWIEVETGPDTLVISLDPGMAFGTGTHPTTQLCLEALEAHVQPGINVLDLGCGSGILSIGAAKLGAQQVLALDIDPIAVEATLENAADNGTASKIVAQEGDLSTVITSARRFDLAVVNILARIIIQMCDQHLGDVIRPGGIGIFSGIIEDQADDVETALRKTGLEPFARRKQGDWVAIEARRPND
ncbi:MAG: 50S ribosomal protein L11 methyltransferase [Anaerolineae bacterium]|nr:50S ribosomal protein L11 methyltransferase [Anaerolineae bacterium]